jgi:SSS family solute:Na+ symporter
MFGFTPLDLAVIGAYIAAVVAVGIWARLRIRTQEQYFLGGRRFGKLIQVFASFGHAATADGPVGVATTTFHNGIAGVWSSLLMVFCTPLFWFTSAWLRRLRIMTMGDFFVERYGSRRMAATYVIIAAVGMMSVLSAGYVAAAMTTTAMTAKPVISWTPDERREYALSNELSQLERMDANGYSPVARARLEELRRISPNSTFSWISPRAVIWAACAITILSAVMGGLAAAFYTAVLQGCCVLALSTMLIPFGISRINGLYGGAGLGSALDTLHVRLPNEFFRIFGSSALPDFTWYYVLTVSAVAGLSVVLQPNQLVTSAAARDETAARVGIVAGSFIKRFCTILWALAGLFAALLYSGTLQNSDMVWGYAARDLLGPANCGLVGLMLVGMLSALMAVSNSLMLTMSGLITANLYRPLRPGKSEVHYVAVGRVSGILFLAGSAFIATQFDALFDIIKLNWEFFTVFSAAFWLGIKWRRANRAGAWASILVTASFFYVIPLILPSVLPGLRSNPTLALETYPRPTTRVSREKQGGSPVFAVLLPARSIFWSQGLARDADGLPIGRGYPYLDLLLLKTIGFDLQRNPSALNETIRIAIRLLLPFAVLCLVASLTPRDGGVVVDRFFVKMRTRVIGGGGNADIENLSAALRDPNHLREVKIFPNSDWEIYRWSRYDAVGFALSVGLVFVILGLVRVLASYSVR